MSWHHTGFNVHIGEVISAGDIFSRERAARYLCRSAVSLEKMRYLPEDPHPHIHSIFSQGCFDKKNTFHLSPDVLDEGKCTKLFMPQSSSCIRF